MTKKPPRKGEASPIRDLADAMAERALGNRLSIACFMIKSRNVQKC